MGKKRKERRPQPAGWDKTVKIMLKPENVERLSDTQVRITLPPIPDFDIEEDERVEFWVPPELLVNSDKPLYAGSVTIKADSYEERIDHAIQGLKEEHASLSPDAAVPSFLLAFFTCEIVAKSVVSHSKRGGKGRKALEDDWTTKAIDRALKHLNIDFNRELVKKLFSEEPSVASAMSARRLRDNIVHRMKRQHRSAVRDRYASLMETMMQFLDAVESWRKRPERE